MVRLPWSRFPIVIGIIIIRIIDVHGVTGGAGTGAAGASGGGYVADIGIMAVGGTAAVGCVSGCMCNRRSR
jgi:hypothetical protein